MTNRFVIAVETDFHAHHRHGLCNPNVTLSDGNDEGYQPSLSEFQKMLWEVRRENIAKLLNFLDGDPLVYFNVGDQINGMKYKGNWMTTNPANQFRIAEANVDPILSLEQISAARFIKGTPSHDGTLAGGAESLQRTYELKYPHLDIKTCWHSLASIYNFEVDAAHHGPGPGSREWLKGNTARYYLKDRMFKDLNNKRDPHHLYLRAHYHEKIWETYNHPLDDGWASATLLLVPPMCGLSSFSRKVTKSVPKIRVGMVVLRVEKRRVIDTQWFTKVFDVRKREVINV